MSGVAARAANDVWAVGQSASGSKPVQAFIEHWNGKVWSVVPTQHIGTSSGLSGVTAISARDAWAVGDADTATLVMHWNGKAWSVVPSPNVANTLNSLSGVAQVPVTHNVWAVGLSRGESAPYVGRTLIMFKN